MRSVSSQGPFPVFPKPRLPMVVARRCERRRQPTVWLEGQLDYLPVVGRRCDSDAGRDLACVAFIARQLLASECRQDFPLEQILNELLFDALVTSMTCANVFKLCSKTIVRINDRHELRRF